VKGPERETLNEPLVPTQEAGEDRIFDFLVKQSGKLNGAVRGYVRESNHFEVYYEFYSLVTQKTYKGSVDCWLTFAKSSLGQSKPDYSFQDIAISVGAINILKDGYTLSFADFDSNGGMDLLVPCIPSLYQYAAGAVTGFGFYLMDRSGQLLIPMNVSQELFSFWADLDADGPLDFLSGGVIYKMDPDSGAVLDAIPVADDIPGYKYTLTYMNGALWLSCSLLI